MIWFSALIWSKRWSVAARSERNLRAHLERHKRLPDMIHQRRQRMPIQFQRRRRNVPIPCLR